MYFTYIPGNKITLNKFMVTLFRKFFLSISLCKLLMPCTRVENEEHTTNKQVDLTSTMLVAIEFFTIGWSSDLHS